ncbi:MAG: tRNA lysidine(34) synthetase TilS [Wenzhouxiangella sp.]|nr:MAG: tRNA lysidine(34) synthetase TilS [Wenzhouxiangella sp.]
MKSAPGISAPAFPNPDSLPGQGRILIAFSGGPDSVCLAANLVESATRRPLLAIHVDHGLDQNSQQRARRAGKLAGQLGLPLHLEQLEAPPLTGGEAAARRARYAIFERHIQDNELLVTGHHSDDQAETMLLRLLRGAGPQGLLGIPQQRQFGRGWIARPLLDWPRSAVVAWLRSRGLEWQDDPTNSDLAMDRNFLRHRIFPLLESRWPGLRQSLARSARLGAGAADALEQMALEDLAMTLGPEQRLDHGRLQTLSRFRQGQVLRYWYLEKQLEPPPARRLDVFLDQLATAANDRQPCLDWAGHRLSLWRAQLWLHRSPRSFDAWRQDWTGEGKLRLPGTLGQLELSGANTSLGSPVSIRLGRKGERLRLQNRCGSRSVNQLMAEAGIPPWQRPLWPRLERDGQVLAVGDRWLDADFGSELSRLSAKLRWQARPGEFVC